MFAWGEADSLREWKKEKQVQKREPHGSRCGCDAWGCWGWVEGVGYSAAGMEPVTLAATELWTTVEKLAMAATVGTETV